MVNDNFIEPNKITLLGWVDKALDQTLTKKNIISRFRVIRFWPWNLKAMEEKTRFNSLYIIINESKGERDDKTSNEKYQDMQWGENYVVIN
jgi:hypothetical protein